MGIFNIQPSQRLGLTDNPELSGILATSQTYTIGALLLYSSGLVAECPGNTANGVAAGTVLGVASDPAVPAITASGGTAIGQEVQPAVGAGSAISGPRRKWYPIGTNQTFIGTLDTSGSLGATALTVTDIGSTFAMNAVTPSTGALVASGGVWMLNRTGTTKSAMVIRLIDPPGAKSTDTPNIAAGNTGNSLVEFVFLSGARLMS